MRDIGLVPVSMFLVLLSSACTDQVNLLATRTLLNRTGLEYEPYAAAVQANFALGSSIAALENFVVSVRGHCIERAPGKTHCEVPEHAPGCYQDLVTIDAESDSEAIQSLQLEEVGIRC